MHFSTLFRTIKFNIFIKVLLECVCVCGGTNEHFWPLHTSHKRNWQAVAHPDESIIFKNTKKNVSLFFIYDFVWIYVYGYISGVENIPMLLPAC